MNTIYKMKHPTIELSSLNPNLVEYWSKELAHISLDDIKQNKIEGRHKLLIELGCAGNAPIFYDYFAARTKRYELFKQAQSELKGDNRIFSAQIAHDAASQKVLEQTGWDLTSDKA